MKLLAVLVSVLIISQTLFAESQVKFALAPQVWQNFGYTEYIMDMAFVTDSGPYLLKSQLEFPLDVTMAGIMGGLYSTRNTLYAWSVEVGYFSNVDDPGRVMKDHDWETVWRVIGPDTVIYWGQVEKFSYTKSKAEMKSHLLTAEGFLRVLHKKHFDLDIWGGFRYQKIEQDIIGYEGWQLLRDSSVARDTAVSGTAPAIYYRVTYKTPHLGLRSNIRLGQYSTLGARAAFALVWTSDFDDHLLRKKTARANISGHGFISSMNARYLIPAGGRFQPFFELAAGFLYFHASGNQTQRWYGDDPITEDDDTGLSLSGIPHEINSLQVSVGVKVGVAF